MRLAAEFTRFISNICFLFVQTVRRVQQQLLGVLNWLLYQ